MDTSDDDLKERPSRSSVIPAGFTISDALRPREEDLHDLVGKSVVIHKSSGWVWGRIIDFQSGRLANFVVELPLFGGLLEKQLLLHTTYCRRDDAPVGSWVLINPPLSEPAESKSEAAATDMDAEIEEWRYWVQCDKVRCAKWRKQKAPWPTNKPFVCGDCGIRCSRACDQCRNIGPCICPDE